MQVNAPLWHRLWLDFCRIRLLWCHPSRDSVSSQVTAPIFREP